MDRPYRGFPIRNVTDYLLTVTKGRQAVPAPETRS